MWSSHFAVVFFNVGHAVWVERDAAKMLRRTRQKIAQTIRFVNEREAPCVDTPNAKASHTGWNLTPRQTVLFNAQSTLLLTLPQKMK
jgi:hypothetical protein